MLASNKMIGFVLTRDTQRARQFYEGVLGFRFAEQNQYALVMETEHNMIRISEVKESVAAPHTILGWEVRDIEKLAGWLKERGVSFERYSWAKQDELGVWVAPGGDKVAWFKDPDGNLLSVSQHVGR
jgi:catechol 2,3-dioxygenase-like lactoylglutathione lyase family enzyme